MKTGHVIEYDYRQGQTIFKKACRQFKKKEKIDVDKCLKQRSGTDNNCPEFK